MELRLNTDLFDTEAYIASSRQALHDKVSRWQADAQELVQYASIHARGVVERALADVYRDDPMVIGFDEAERSSDLQVFSDQGGRENLLLGESSEGRQAEPVDQAVDCPPASVIFNLLFGPNPKSFLSREQVGHQLPMTIFHEYQKALVQDPSKPVVLRDFWNGQLAEKRREKLAMGGVFKSAKEIGHIVADEADFGIRSHLEPASLVFQPPEYGGDLSVQDFLVVADGQDFYAKKIFADRPQIISPLVPFLQGRDLTPQQKGLLREMAACFSRAMVDIGVNRLQIKKDEVSLRDRVIEIDPVKTIADITANYYPKQQLADRRRSKPAEDWLKFLYSGEGICFGLEFGYGKDKQKWSNQAYLLATLDLSAGEFVRQIALALRKRTSTHLVNLQRACGGYGRSVADGLDNSSQPAYEGVFHCLATWPGVLAKIHVKRFEQSIVKWMEKHNSTKIKVI